MSIASRTVTSRPANGDVPGTNNSLPASNTNYNGQYTNNNNSGSDITGATNADANTEGCRATQ